eukprot:4223956-Prymnesium_polylepis.1
MERADLAEAAAAPPLDLEVVCHLDGAHVVDDAFERAIRSQQLAHEPHAVEQVILVPILALDEGLLLPSGLGRGPLIQVEHALARDRAASTRAGSRTAAAVGVAVGGGSAEANTRRRRAAARARPTYGGAESNAAGWAAGARAGCAGGARGATESGPIGGARDPGGVAGAARGRADRVARARTRALDSALG